MICPNPIAVTSAGIRGVFDIQRVIIKMQDPDALRANIANAISGQYIDGWCAISTGFSFTLVAFSCERDVLKQQLDIGEIVQQDILTDDTESTRQTTSTTTEQRRLARMVNFVQEPDLHAIAGEWVLARFAAVEGARWFLCRLELGSGSDFYAHRISTDACSFHNAIPQRGLIEYWDRYMWNKKALACWVLDSFLDSKISSKPADEVWQKIEERARQAEAQDANSSGNSDVIAWEGAKMVGNFVPGMAYQQWAKHLESNIEKNAMDKIPIRLQGAILDLNKQKALLPSMFHSGREIHMF